MLVLGKRRDNLLSPFEPLKKGRQQKCRYRTSSELENSVLEINHVTNVTVTTVLDESAASDRVSRSYNECDPDIFVLFQYCVTCNDVTTTYVRCFKNKTMYLTNSMIYACWSSKKKKMYVI